MESLWYASAVAAIGIALGLVLVAWGNRLFKVEEPNGDTRGAEPSLLVLRSASRIITAGIVLLLLSFGFVWTLELVRTILN